MELTGNDAERWEQMSNKTQELEQKIASYCKLIKGVGSTLTKLTASLEETRQTADRLSNLAYKEVLRQESGTINADDDYGILESSQPEPITQLTQSVSESVARSQPKDKPKTTSKKRKRTTKAKTAPANQVGLLDNSDEE